MTQRTFDGLVRSLADLRRTRDLLCACEQWARRALVNEVPKEEALGAIIEYGAENEPCPACLARCRWGTEWQQRVGEVEGKASILLGEKHLAIGLAEEAKVEAERLRKVLDGIALATTNALAAGIETLDPMYGRAMRALSNVARAALADGAAKVKEEV